ncbi:DNA helicase [Tanacetum coccineum]
MSHQIPGSRRGGFQKEDHKKKEEHQQIRAQNQHEGKVPETEVKVQDGFRNPQRQFTDFAEMSLTQADMSRIEKRRIRQTTEDNSHEEDVLPEAGATRKEEKAQLFISRMSPIDSLESREKSLESPLERYDMEDMGQVRNSPQIKKGATKEELIAALIVESHLWWHFKICTLKENMRHLTYDLTTKKRQRSEAFAKCLLDVGNGEIREPDEKDAHASS